MVFQIFECTFPCFHGAGCLQLLLKATFVVLKHTLFNVCSPSFSQCNTVWSVCCTLSELRFQNGSVLCKYATNLVERCCQSEHSTAAREGALTVQKSVCFHSVCTASLPQGRVGVDVFCTSGLFKGLKINLDENRKM